MTENLWVLGSGPELKDELLKHDIGAQYIDLRKGHDSDEIMDIYEQIAPEMCAVVRQEILSINPDKIVVVGRSKDYLWDGTIVARLFGQFNSWHTQWEDDFGHTVIKVGDKSVSLYAIESIKDWNYTDEK